MPTHVLLGLVSDCLVTVVPSDKKSIQNSCKSASDTGDGEGGPVAVHAHAGGSTRYNVLVVEISNEQIEHTREASPACKKIMVKHFNTMFQ